MSFRDVREISLFILLVDTSREIDITISRMGGFSVWAFL